MVVFLADPHIIRRALSHPDVQGRAEIFSFQIFSYSQNLGKLNVYLTLNLKKDVPDQYLLNTIFVKHYCNVLCQSKLS